MKRYDEIVEVKDKILNATLLVGIVLGILTFLLSLRNFYESETRFNYYATLLAIGLMLTVYVYRFSLSHSLRSAMVIIGIVILSFADIYKLGAYSPAKALLVFIPFFGAISFSKRKNIAISVFAILVYLIFSYLFNQGYIQLTVDINTRIQSISSWMVNLLIIAIVAFGVTEIFRNYNTAFFTLIKRLEEQNKELRYHRENLEIMVAERSKDLETANEELVAINEELYQSKNVIENQNIELKSTLEHLQATQAKLFQSEKMASLGILSAGVAHEINNPLNFIMGGYVGLSQHHTQANTKDERVDFSLNAIKTGVDRASEIVKALNQFSTPGNLDEETCQIQKIVNNCLTILNNQFERYITVEKNFSPIPVQVTGNCGKLHQAFFNILTNALQSISEKGVVRVKVNVLKGHGLIEISDTGCGISLENVERVTEPFFTTKEPGRGVGLGLSIAYAIIKEHKGTLSIESEQGKGTRVVVALPVSSES